MISDAISIKKIIHFHKNDKNITSQYNCNFMSMLIRPFYSIQKSYIPNALLHNAGIFSFFAFLFQPSFNPLDRVFDSSPLLSKHTN